MRKAVKWGIGILVFMVVVQTASTGDSGTAGTTPADSAREAEAALRQEDMRLRVQARGAIQARLRDPESAKIRDLVVVRGDSLTAVCGWVNAKNGFGGYTGDQRVLVINGTAIMKEDLEERQWVEAWNRSCVKE